MIDIHSPISGQSFIVVTGNLMDGLGEVFGPFSEREEASEWANYHIGENWRLANLTHVDQTTEPRNREIQEAMNEVNDEYITWDIQYHENEHSTWYSASTHDTTFQRANLGDLISICHLLSGRKRAEQIA